MQMARLASLVQRKPAKQNAVKEGPRRPSRRGKHRSRSRDADSTEFWSGSVLERPQATGALSTGHPAAEAQADRLGAEVGQDTSSEVVNGKFLSPTFRRSAERTLGTNLGGVELHRDAAAASKAEQHGALAVTEGNQIHFARGTFNPRTPEGRRLIGHEVTHAAQQRAHGVTIKQAKCPPQVPALESDPPPLIYDNRAPSMLEKRRERPAVGSAQEKLNGFLKAYAAGEAACVQSADVQKLEELRSQLKHPDRIEVDCVFGDNTTRATRMFQICTGLGNDGKIGAETWPKLLDFKPSKPPSPSPSPQPKPTPTGHVCGPDVTNEVRDTVNKTRSTFAGWTKPVREDHCDALDSLSTGKIAWDIAELHNRDWIFKGYRPTCATKGANPPCGQTVQVGSDCSYGGSPNYVIFGVMFRLCFNHHLALTNVKGVNRFSRNSMNFWISVYKPFSGNLASSKNWANAGFSGWPSAATPAGDRLGCQPVCPLPNRHGPFTTAWLRFSTRSFTAIK